MGTSHGQHTDRPLRRFDRAPDGDLPICVPAPISILQCVVAWERRPRVQSCSAMEDMGARETISSRGYSTGSLATVTVYEGQVHPQSRFLPKEGTERTIADYQTLWR